MNGQHLRALPPPEQLAILGTYLVSAGIVEQPAGPFVEKAVAVCAEKCELAADVARDLTMILGYQLEETAAGEMGAAVMKEEGFAAVGKAVVEAHASGALAAVVAGGHDAWKEWAKALGKELKLKGKGLFMPLRILLTGNMEARKAQPSPVLFLSIPSAFSPDEVDGESAAAADPPAVFASFFLFLAQGPDIGEQLVLLGMAKGNLKDEAMLVPLDKRIELLKKHLA